MDNIEIQDIIINTIVETLAVDIHDDKILNSISKRLRTKKFKKEIYYKITKEIFYKLLMEKKLKLVPGFGSVSLKEVRGKNKKIFNKKTGEMEVKQIKGSHKIVYAAGDLINEFL